MILTELNEEELKEQELKVKKEIRFIVSKISSITFYLTFFFLVLTYLFLLAKKSDLEKRYSQNIQHLKVIENQISIYSDLLTTQLSIDTITKKLKIQKLFLPEEIWYIYQNQMIKIGGKDVD
ncbi:MAG: hypothetical protein ABDH21_02305 [bacterium]